MKMTDAVLGVVPVGEAHALGHRDIWRLCGMGSLISVRQVLRAHAEKSVIRSKLIDAPWTHGQARVYWRDEPTSSQTVTPDMNP